MKYEPNSRFAQLLTLIGLFFPFASTIEAQPWPECCIEVTHIKFNHDFASTEDGINIRPTSTTQLEHNTDGDGEWIGPPHGSRNEQACWVHNSTSVKIYVRLEIYTTVDEDQCAFDPLVIPVTAIVWAESADASLPNVTERQVDFLFRVSVGDAAEDYVRFDLENPIPAGIEHGQASLQWYSRDAHVSGTQILVQPPGTVWDETLTGPHECYRTLGPPGSPWVLSDPTSDATPWASCLDYLCSGQPSLRGVSDLAVVASVVTGRAFAEKKYDHVDGASSFQPTTDAVKLESYINTVLGTTNCFAQAGATCALINIVGGDAKRRSLGPVFGGLGHCFGYIEASPVVGGVKCNNPFYANPEISKVPMWGPPTNLTRIDNTNGDALSDRDYFSDHSWVLINGLVYDSTIGPFVGGGGEAAFFVMVRDLSSPGEERHPPSPLFPHPPPGFVAIPLGTESPVDHPITLAPG